MPRRARADPGGTQQRLRGDGAATPGRLQAVAVGHNDWLVLEIVQQGSHIVNQLRSKELEPDERPPLARECKGC